MSALANDCLPSERDGSANELSVPSSWEDTSMRARLETLRNTILVVAVQMIFRATLTLRRWNY